MYVLRSIWVVCNKIQINILFSHVCEHQYDKRLIEDLPLLVVLNVELNIRAQSELHYIARKNSTILPGLYHETTISRIDGIKFIDLVVEMITKITSHNKLRSFLYDISILPRNSFDLVACVGSKHMRIICLHLFQLWVDNYIYDICGGNCMRYK